MTLGSPFASECHLSMSFLFVRSQSCSHLSSGSDLLVSMHALQTEEFAVRAGVLPSPAVLKHATTNAGLLHALSPSHRGADFSDFHSGDAWHVLCPWNHLCRCLC